ncbi:molecular chaperone DjlA [Marinilabiliaceae bacterium JC017]|nr:molecular chaperone DjlA [Marinilabiliaceae bacterium JC017]
MGIWGSLLGVGVGWWMLGPIGAIMGLIVGHVAEESSDKNWGDRQGYSGVNVNRDGFVAALLVLVAAVMKADGKVLRSELDYVKRSLVNNWGEVKASEALLHLRDILKHDIPIAEVSHQIRVNLDYSSRLELLHLLFGIALADGSLSRVELNLIQNIGEGLGISQSDYLSIHSLFHKNTDAAYKVLEVDASVSNEDLKKAYRKMAMRYHPDKVSHLGEDFQRSANEKFRKVNEAFERIKKERGIK